jgi:hypothetical protein
MGKAGEKPMQASCSFSHGFAHGLFYEKVYCVYGPDLIMHVYDTEHS